MFNKKPFREGDPVLLVTGSRHNGVRSYRPSTVSKVLKNGNFRVQAYPKKQYRQTGHAIGERDVFFSTRPVVHHDTDDLRDEIDAERQRAEKAEAALRLCADALDVAHSEVRHSDAVQAALRQDKGDDG